MEFDTASRPVIWIMKVGKVSILLAERDKIELHNILLISECNSNLISSGQLRKSRITYHNNPAAIILIRNREVIAGAKKDWNLFTLDLAQPGRVMTVVIKTPKAMAITGRS